MDNKKKNVWKVLKSLIKHEGSSRTSGGISDSVIEDLRKFIGSELSRGNLLRQFRLQLLQSERKFIQLQFLKTSESMMGIVRPHTEVVVIESHGTSQSFHKFTSNELSMLEIPPDYVVQDGLRLIFSWDVETALTYIARTKAQASDTFVYLNINNLVVDNYNYLTRISTGTEEAFGQSNWKLEELELKWSDLDYPCRHRVLKKFRTENEQPVAKARSNNIINGELLLTLLHTNITMEKLLKNASIFMKAKDLLEIFPITRHVKHRNYFGYGMLTDPVLQGSKMKLISSTINESVNSEETCQYFSQNTSSNSIDESHGCMHTFKLVKDGTLEYDFSHPLTGNWLVTEPPTLQWISTQPPEKFCDLQIVLMKHGVHSDLELADNIMLPLPMSNLSRQHCILSGESGAGKTTVLKCLLKKFLDQYMKFPNLGVVALVNFADVIKFLEPDLQPSKTTMAKAILASIRESTSFSDYDWDNLYQILISGRGATPVTSSCPVFLFLDGMDHVGFENLEKSFDVVKFLHREFRHVSICVTTRPNLVLRLEAILMTFAHNLEMLENPVELAEYIDCDSSFKIVPYLENHRSNRLISIPQGLMMLKAVGENPEIMRPKPHESSTYQTCLVAPFDNILFYVKYLISIWIQNHPDDYTKEPWPKGKILLAAFRYYAVTLMCPLFSLAQGFSTLVLEGITKEKLEELGLYPFPSDTSLDCGLFAAYAIAEILDELLKKCNHKEAFDLLTTFLEKYYLLNVEKISVYEVNSVYKNVELQDKLHFDNVFEILNEISSICTTVPDPSSDTITPPFESKLKDILLVAALYGHKRIFNFFSATSMYKECLKGNWKFIEFIVSTGHFFYPCFHKLNILCHEFQTQGLIQLLKFQSLHKSATLWGATSVHTIFDEVKPSYMECIMEMFKELMTEPSVKLDHRRSEGRHTLRRESLTRSFDQRVQTITKYVFPQFTSRRRSWSSNESTRFGESTIFPEITTPEVSAIFKEISVPVTRKSDFRQSTSFQPTSISELVGVPNPNMSPFLPPFPFSEGKYDFLRIPYYTTTICDLIVNSENINITASVIDFLHFLLEINPAAANGIYRGDYLTSLGILLKVKVNPFSFFHKNPIFRDIYRLVTSFPDKLSSTIKESIIDTVEGGLKAYNLEEKWAKQCKTWYTDIYSEILNKVYEMWLEQHEDWWENNELTLTKEIFLKACASIAFDDRFTERKAPFRLQVPSGFATELADIGLIDDSGGRPYFFHDTISDYLIAWFIANVGFEVDYRDFKDFMMNSVIAIDSGEHSQMKPGHTCNKFENFFICYFLDELTDVHCPVGVLLQRGTEVCLKDSSSSSPSEVVPGLANILQTFYNRKHYNLLNLFARECYEEFFNEGELQKLSFQILENISRPLVKIAITLIKSAAKLGVLETMKKENGETICDVARKSCTGKPFENQIMNCFPNFKARGESSGQ